MKLHVIGTIGALSLALAACGNTQPAAARHAAARPPVTAPAATPTSASAAPALSTQDAAFVAAFRAKLAAEGKADSATGAQEARAAESVCTSRRQGAAQSSIASSAAAVMIARLAEKYICPSYLPRVLLRLSGSGIQNSAPFQVTSGTDTVAYSYDCSSQGTGNFIADLTDGSDDQSIANALSSGGHATTTVYPTDLNAGYHVAVNSECSWSLTVSSG